MKQVRSLFSAAALSLSLLALPASGRTTLYVSPADASLASPISVTAAEAHQVLSHHLDVATSAVVDADADADADAGARIWAHLGSSSSQQPELELELEHEDGHGRARVERLFDGGDDKNRLLVLVHGASDRTDIVPDSMRATHQIGSSSSHSFDALLHSYMSDLRQSLRLSDSMLAQLGSEASDALERASSWFMGLDTHTEGRESASASWQWWQQAKQLASSSKSAAMDVVESELAAVHGLLERVRDERDADKDGDALSFQPLRFQGLADVRAEYGADSVEFGQVVELLRSALAELTSAFERRSSAQGRGASMALVLNDDRGTGTGTGTGTLSKRDMDLSSGQALKPQQRAKRGPQCYSSASDLERDTNGCSGHGKAVESSQGGRKCWRCACTPTRPDKGGKVTYWAGSACEKKDVSSEFILLAGSALVLALVAAGSVYVLYSAGSTELPGTLSGVTINLK